MKNNSSPADRHKYQSRRFFSVEHWASLLLIASSLWVVATENRAQPLTNRYGQYLSKDLKHLRDSARLSSIIDLSTMKSPTLRYDYQPSRKLQTDSSLFVSQRIELTNGQYMILNTPRQKQAAPVAIFIHGGAWMGGSPDRYAEECRYLPSLGLASVRVSYPLIPKGGTIEMALSTIRSAIEYLKAHAKELNLDTSRLGFCGDSAGAYLSGMMAFSTPECRAWIGISGTYDLTATPPQGNFPSEKNLQDFFGTSIRENLQSYSPLFLIPERAPATLLFHGTGDLIITSERSQELCMALRKNRKNNATLHLLPLYSHTYSIRGYSDFYERGVVEMGQFFKTNL